jgi:Protein of unknown function (DUF3106)
VRARGIYAVSIAALLALAAPGGAAFAQAPPDSAPGAVAGNATHVPWTSLSPDQQRLLSSFSGNWESLPAQRQQALANGSNRWLQMTPEQRGAARQRFQRWQALPPAERQQLRQRWEQFRSLPPDRQRAVRENFRKFQSLPPQRRQALRQRWQAATPAERQQMLQQARQRAFERQQMRPQPQQMRPQEFPGRRSFGAPRARRQMFQPAPFRPYRQFGPQGGGARGRHR